MIFSYLLNLPDIWPISKFCNTLFVEIFARRQIFAQRLCLREIARKLVPNIDVFWKVGKNKLLLCNFKFKNFSRFIYFFYNGPKNLSTLSQLYINISSSPFFPLKKV